MSATDISGYRYAGAAPGHHHAYLLPSVVRLLDGLGLPDGQRRLFELGCGNGSMATLGELLREAGFVDVRFERVGRVPALAKSMIAITRKP